MIEEMIIDAIIVGLAFMVAAIISGSYAILTEPRGKDYEVQH